MTDHALDCMCESCCRCRSWVNGLAAIAARVAANRWRNEHRQKCEITRRTMTAAIMRRENLEAGFRRSDQPRIATDFTESGGIRGPYSLGDGNRWIASKRYEEMDDYEYERTME